jgi:hypothetical protein
MTEHVETAEEKAFGTLLDEKRDEITEAARELIGIALDCAYAYNLCRNYAFQPEEFYMADHNVLGQAHALTEHDREALAAVAQAAQAASDSLDKDDFETSAGLRIRVADLHGYYAMIYSMIEKALKPTNRWEINLAQFELWRDYGDWRASEMAEARPARKLSDEDVWEVPF